MISARDFRPAIPAALRSRVIAIRRDRVARIPLVACHMLLRAASWVPILALHAGYLPRQRLRSAPAALRASANSAQVADASAWIADMNEHHIEELAQVARLCPEGRLVDWSVEELHRVEIVGANEDGVVLQEVLCSAADQRCIAVDVPVQWPEGVCPRKADELQRAFETLAMRLYSSEDDSMPFIYESQQRQLNGVMALLNAQHGSLLKYYAVRHAREAFAPTEEVLSARMTQLTFEGLSLEVETRDVLGEMLSDDAGAGSAGRHRSTTDVSILFDSPTASAEQTEDALIRMFAAHEGSSANGEAGRAG